MDLLKVLYLPLQLICATLLTSTRRSANNIVHILLLAKGCMEDVAICRINSKIMVHTPNPRI